MYNTTEEESNYSGLEKMNADEILINMNREDRTVAEKIHHSIPEISKLVTVIAERMRRGGRLFYIGAGTSGRMGVIDASECPPTFGVPDNLVVGLIAGGEKALRKSVENAEDDMGQAWIDLEKYHINGKDSLLGIAASGNTPYVLGGIQAANKAGIVTGCIVCNERSPIAAASQYPVEIIVGPEFITGSTRLKAGTAQKLVLNMLSTSLMVLLGHIKGNKMVDMQLSNNKLVNRGIRIIMEEAKVDSKTASELLGRYGNIRCVLKHYQEKLKGPAM